MPRAAKKHANQHNNRHENGVVAPGKRITKQKSNGYLDGSLDERLLPDTPPSPSPSPNQPRPNPHNQAADGCANGPKQGCNGTVASYETEVTLFEEGWEGLESPQHGTKLANGSQGLTHRKIDVNASKNPAVHENSNMRLALTILKSCPLGDTIAILICLLWLPPTLLSIANALFAVLTFIPPAGTLATLPATLIDIFQGFGGTPSFITVCLTDMIGLGLWLIMFTPIQNIALELSQAVVATTLGGATSSRNGGSDSTLLCMFIVSLTHAARHKPLAQRLWRYAREIPAFSYFEPSNIPPPLPPEQSSSVRSPVSWFRIVVSLHILTQGLVRIARRWYTKREYSQGQTGVRKHDFEAIANSNIHLEGLPSMDATFPVYYSTTSESTPKMSIASLREARETVSSGKRKRKQGTYVRSRQPLWAAFAATKVTFLREYAQVQAQGSASTSKATDPRNLGSAPFELEEGRIWITRVWHAGFCFDTSFFNPIDAVDNQRKGNRAIQRTEIRQEKPFYVRINGADWTSTRIAKAIEDERLAGSPGDQWTGEVFGLSPACTYTCTFLRREDNMILYSTSLFTPALSTADQVSSALASPSFNSLRPSSPSTTLRNSISAVETNLSDSHARQRRIRKDNKASTAAIKKDIEVLNAKLAKAGGDDKTRRSRQVQSSQLIRQAEEAISSISSQIDAMSSIPEADSQEWRAKRNTWDQQRSLHSDARDNLLRAKEQARREISSVQAEASTVQQKRERLQHRSAKLSDQLSRAQSFNVDGFNERDRKDVEQHGRDAERLQGECLARDQVASLTQSIYETQSRARHAWQQAQMLENAFEQQQMLSHQTLTVDGAPITPEGDLPGTHTLSQPPDTGFKFPSYFSSSSDLQPSPLGNSALAAPANHDFGRVRSTSVLSNNSVYTDFSDADPAPPMPSSRARVFDQIFGDRERQQSGSSESRNGSGPGSAKDPVSPVGIKASPVWR